MPAQCIACAWQVGQLAIGHRGDLPGRGGGGSRTSGSFHTSPPPLAIAPNASWVAAAVRVCRSRKCRAAPRVRALLRNGRRADL